MKVNFVLFTSVICLSGLFSPLFGGQGRSSSAEVRVGLNEQFDDKRYQVWMGQGWYYGLWFDDKFEYYHWLENRFYEVKWGGPGWYYGIYFSDKNDWDDFRDHHHYYKSGHWKNKGDIELHRQKHQGNWRESGNGKRKG